MRVSFYLSSNSIILPKRHKKTEKRSKIKRLLYLWPLIPCHGNNRTIHMLIFRVPATRTRSAVFSGTLKIIGTNSFFYPLYHCNSAVVQGLNRRIIRVEWRHARKPQTPWIKCPKKEQANSLCVRFFNFIPGQAGPFVAGWRNYHGLNGKCFFLSVNPTIYG